MPLSCSLFFFASLFPAPLLPYFSLCLFAFTEDLSSIPVYELRVVDYILSFLQLYRNPTVISLTTKENKSRRCAIMSSLYVCVCLCVCLR